MESQKEIPFGLKAINVASLYNVNISRNMPSRLATHKIVFGILNLVSIQAHVMKGYKIRQFLMHLAAIK